MWVRSVDGVTGQVYRADDGEHTFVFAVVRLPEVPDAGDASSAAVGDGYAYVILYRPYMKSYPINLDTPQMGWGYIADKFNLSDEEGKAFCKALAKVVRDFCGLDGGGARGEGRP